MREGRWGVSKESTKAKKKMSQQLPSIIVIIAVRKYIQLCNLIIILSSTLTTITV